MTSSSLLDQAIPILPLNKSDERISAIIDKFSESFNGAKPSFFCKSPGRVNLIGEHIDYSGYSVLPMAIGRDTLMAVGIVEDAPQPFVELVNMDDKYPKRKFLHENDGHVTIDPTIHEWSNYFKCGYKGVLDELNPKNVVSLQIVVDGTVPTGSGLSSSSAFVCCSALATLHGNNLVLNKGQLTRTAIKSETYAGVQIGGMDQSISIMAPKGSALLIDFYPSLNATPISLPQSNPAPMFVIANTMVTSDKHVTAPKNYNLRVVECRFSAAILAKKLSLSVKGPHPTLKQVHEAYSQSIGKSDLEKSFSDMINQVENIFHENPYSLEEIASLLELSLDQVTETFIENIKIIADGFKLYQRSLHVFQEASRVYEFRNACLGDASTFLERAGSLMNQSHMSCKILFECSCPELDEITQLCRDAGAYGSRLTGAGWGGCSVSLVAKDKVDSFIENLKEKYYFKRLRNDGNALKTLDEYLFASEAEIGATIFQ